MQNIYNIPTPKNGEESIKELYKTNQVSINHIRSNSYVLSHWYIQEEDEWLVLFEGEATLEVEGKELMLQRGDTFFIPAKQRHRVLSTSEDAQWLTVHMNATHA